MRLYIKEHAQAHGLRLIDLAEKLGVSKNTIQVHLNGQTRGGKFYPPNPSVDVLDRMAGAIGCSVTDFFVDPNEPKEQPQHQEHESSYICPHCGKPLQIEIKEL